LERLALKLPESLKEDFQIIAIKLKKSMTEIIIELVVDFVKKNKHLIKKSA